MQLIPLPTVGDADVSRGGRKRMDVEAGNVPVVVVDISDAAAVIVVLLQAFEHLLDSSSLLRKSDEEALHESVSHVVDPRRRIWCRSMKGSERLENALAG